MLPWFLVIAGILWILLGVARVTGFKHGGERFIEAVSKMFFIFGILHLALAVFLMIAPTPFGALANNTISTNTTFQFQTVNTTTLNFNSTGSSTGNSTMGNIFVNSSNSTKTVSYTYNVFGTGLMTFISYAYFLILFVYLFFFALGWLIQAFTRKKEDNDEE